MCRRASSARVRVCACACATKHTALLQSYSGFGFGSDHDTADFPSARGDDAQSLTSRSSLSPPSLDADYGRPKFSGSYGFGDEGMRFSEDGAGDGFEPRRSTSNDGQQPRGQARPSVYLGFEEEPRQPRQTVYGFGSQAVEVTPEVLFNDIDSNKDGAISKFELINFCSK